MVDNGPEFAGRVLDERAYRKGIKLNFIRPGKPIENAYTESFNGRLRDECQNTNWFLSLKHAIDVIEDWRKDYNTVRPHSSLGGLAPEEFMELAGNAKMELALTTRVRSEEPQGFIYWDLTKCCVRKWTQHAAM
jgi:transposase InsO family protein